MKDNINNIKKLFFFSFLDIKNGVEIISPKETIVIVLKIDSNVLAFIFKYLTLFTFELNRLNFVREILLYFLHGFEVHTITNGISTDFTLN